MLPRFTCLIHDARRTFVGDEHSETRGAVDEEGGRRYETCNDRSVVVVLPMPSQQVVVVMVVSPTPSLWWSSCWSRCWNMPGAQSDRGKLNLSEWLHTENGLDSNECNRCGDKRQECDGGNAE